MKKLTHKQQLRLYLASRKRWRNRLKRRGKKNIPQSKMVLKAPVEMSFSRNYNATVKFFEEFKKAQLEKRNRRRDTNGRRPRIALRLDLSTIKTISIPAAVVLAAEIDRWRRVDGIALKPYRYQKWSPRLQRVMCCLGVFDLLGFRHGNSEGDIFENNITLVKLKSDDKAEGADVKELLQSLKEMTERFSSKPFLYDAISEAIQNSTEHAYPNDIKLEYPVGGKRWWATVSFDMDTENLRFFVYDQGVGIAKTLPTQGFWENFRAFAKTYSGGMLDSDIALMKAAMEYGRSGTNDSERGKGLAKMSDAIDKAGEGEIRIISGKGEIRRNIDGVTTRALNTHLGGTLVEWAIPLKVFETLREGNNA